MPESQRSSQRAARIARRRLRPKIFKWSFARQFSSCHTVQCDSTSENQVIDSRFVENVTAHSQQRLINDALNAGSQIHFTLRQQCLWLARRTTEKFMKVLAGCCQSGDVVEVALI